MSTKPKVSKLSQKAKKTKKPKLNVSIPMTATPHYCTLTKIPERIFGPEVGPGRAKMIALTLKKWVNGTKLKYYFFNSPNDGSPASWKGDTTQKNAVKNAFGLEKFRYRFGI